MDLSWHPYFLLHINQVHSTSEPWMGLCAPDLRAKYCGVPLSGKGVDSFHQILKSLGKPKQLGTSLTEYQCSRIAKSNITSWNFLLDRTTPDRKKGAGAMMVGQTTKCLAGLEPPSGPSNSRAEFLCSTSSLALSNEKCIAQKNEGPRERGLMKSFRYHLGASFCGGWMPLVESHQRKACSFQELEGL